MEVNEQVEVLNGKCVMFRGSESLVDLQSVCVWVLSPAECQP